MADVQAIRFKAQVQKVQTLADGGLRVTLDLSEKDLEAVTDLMECKRIGALIEIAALPVKVESLTDLDDETEKEAERISDNSDSSRIEIRRNQ